MSHRLLLGPALDAFFDLEIAGALFKFLPFLLFPLLALSFENDPCTVLEVVFPVEAPATAANHNGSSIAAPARQ
jgi:hypothetical protein